MDTVAIVAKVIPYKTRIQSELTLKPLCNIHPHPPLGILVSVLIGGNVRASTVIDTPPINSGTVIACPESSLIVIYLRSLVATTRKYTHPAPAMITLIYIILIIY